MVSKFYPKPAHFEKKSQVCPNSLVFNHELSDSGMRLILALNAIATCAPNWVACQTDLQNRFRWGEEKMRNAIKDCEKHGYLIARQSRKKGRFGQNEFEFDIDGGYPKNNDNLSEEECPHIEYQPSGGQPDAVEPDAGNPGLLSIKNIPISKNKELLLGDSANSFFEKEEKENFPVKDDVHAYCIRRKLDWKSEEIDFAWEVYKENHSYVGDIYAYIKGVIRKNRNFEESKRVKEQKKTEEVCRKTTPIKETIKKKPEIVESRSVGTNTLIQPLRDLIAQLNLS